MFQGDQYSNFTASSIHFTSGRYKITTLPNRHNENHFNITKDQSVDLLIKTCLENGVTNERQIAYVLATTQHETMNFQKPEEIDGRRQAQKLHYQGGTEYFGRGYVHVTHERNYRALGEAIGLGDELARHPGKAKEPEIAAKIAIVGMRDGLFTGKELSEYINDKHVNYEGARRIINGTDKAGLIAGYARDWEKKVPDLVKAAKEHGVQVHEVAPREKHHGHHHRGHPGVHGPGVVELQTKLGQLGYLDPHGKPIKADGKFGPHTHGAVKAFQHDHHLKETGATDPATLKAIDATLKERGAQTQAAPTAPPTTGQTHTSNRPAEQQVGGSGLTDSALYKQALAGLEKYNAEHRIPSTNEQNQNIAGALAVDAEAKGLKQIDHVEPSSNGSRIIAVQGTPGHAHSRVVDVDTMVALNTPVAQSSQAFADAHHNQQQNQRSQQMNQPVQTQTAPALH